jgi:hypothetical protein
LSGILQGVIRLKNIALGMDDELTKHEQLLEEVDGGMDRVHDRLENNTAVVKDIGQKTKIGWMFWIVIVLVILIFM